MKYKINYKWIIKHIPNLIIRVITFDKYYICEKCNSIHRRDGKELKMDIDQEPSLLYKSVSFECYVKQQREVGELLRKSMFKQLQ